MSEIERMQAFHLERDRVLELVRDVSETVVSPEPEPRKPAGFMGPDMAEQLRKGGEWSQDLAATNEYHRLSDEAKQRNRRSYGSLLWACHELRSFRDTPHFGKLGVPLTHALVRFGNADNVPESAVDRRALVEAWQPGQRAQRVAA